VYRNTPEDKAFLAIEFALPRKIMMTLVSKLKKAMLLRDSEVNIQAQHFFDIQI
jgi:hypothetical protein